MNSFVQILKFIGGNIGSRQGAFLPIRRSDSAPKIISTHVGNLEHRLTFGFAVKAKLAISHFLLTHNRHQLMRPLLLYGLTLLLAVSVAGWAGSTVFSSQPQGVLSSPAETIFSEVPLSEAGQEQLVSVFESTLEKHQPDLVSASTLVARTALINRYLQEWKSPLAEFSDVIAAQPHWKLILAISFAESGLGKRCADNNCSGIGVAPDHPNWQTYETKGDWVKALNRLLEKRYKNWTLEKMNGVYNQPGSSNWLAATNRILNELEYRQVK